MSSRPPVFIALRANNRTVGHVRADQIEGIYVVESDRTRIRMCSGVDAYTDGTLAQVFAKMADALNLDPTELR